jgi:hypothetical protein
MKKFTKALSSLLLLLLFTITVFPQDISHSSAAKVAQQFLTSCSSEYRIQEIKIIEDNNQPLAYLARLNPAGFILISRSTLLNPVIAYSFESNWNIGGDEELIFHALITADLKCRLLYPDLSTSNLQKVSQRWDAFLNGQISRERFEQWPPEGTTPTGGWLEANWTQNAPYNNMCPTDPNTHQRGLAGCPAVAMAMIVNCLKEINGTRLSDADDYYHNFGANNKYWIDDDWADYGFPRFDSLNLYLDTIENNFQQQKPLNPAEKAALTFACGTALKQVYSSSISGTYGMSQAGTAYQRFGFEESRLVLAPDTAENRNLAENIKQGVPAHLGLVDPDHTVGHNVVVDGYNTDEFFHLNFGWGGSANGWYTMPPVSAPYNLTVIEGIVLNILGGQPVSVNKEPEKNNPAEIFFYPENRVLRIALNVSPANQLSINIFSVTGQLLFTRSIKAAGQQKYFELNLPAFTGFVIVQVSDGHSVLRSEKLLMNY